MYFPRTVRSALIDSKLWAYCVYIFFEQICFFFHLDLLVFAVYPIKFATTKWRTMWAKRKSANARSGRMLSKLEAFSGLACILRLTPRMKLATQLMNPDRNALNGKVPTRQQWKTDGRKRSSFWIRSIFMKHEFLADFYKKTTFQCSTKPIITHL